MIGQFHALADLLPGSSKSSTDGVDTMTKRKILPLPEIELHSSTQSAVSHFTDL
jgi:hypothetical protein